MPHTLIIGLALVAATAHASQVHPEAVGLDQVLQTAQQILVVEPADPPQRSVADGVVHGEPCPYGVARYVVRQQLLAPDGTPAVGQTIEVAEANYELYCAMAQAYERGDPVPSPILPEYHGDQQAPTAGPRIVYLTPSGNGPLRFAISNAWDPTSELEALKARLAPPPPTPPAAD